MPRVTSCSQRAASSPTPVKRQNRTAQEAIRLEPRLGEAWALLGLEQCYRGDAETAAVTHLHAAMLLPADNVWLKALEHAIAEPAHTPGDGPGAAHANPNPISRILGWMRSLVAAQPETAVQAVPVRITVNGTPREAEVEPRLCWSTSCASTCGSPAPTSAATPASAAPAPSIWTAGR